MLCYQLSSSTTSSLNPEDKLAELCSSASQQSLYMPSPRALDNIRQLKQFGLPSLVENLITIHKPGKLIKIAHIFPLKNGY